MTGSLEVKHKLTFTISSEVKISSISLDQLYKFHLDLM